jgi:hypothetical protein
MGIKENDAMVWTGSCEHINERLGSRKIRGTSWLIELLAPQGRLSSMKFVAFQAKRLAYKRCNNGNNEYVSFAKGTTKYVGFFIKCMVNSLRWNGLLVLSLHNEPFKVLKFERMWVMLMVETALNIVILL